MPKKKVVETKKETVLFCEDKMNRLKKIMQEKNKEFKGTILKFAKDELPPSRISFGLKGLDKLTGGLPSKRFSVIYGQKGTGKTTLAYKAIAEAQKLGKLCAFIDLERSFDMERAQYFGVNLDYLVLANQFENAEQALDTFIEMAREKSVDFIVLDSIQALSPKGEQESKKGKVKSIEDDTMALLARKLSQFFRMSSASVYTGDVTVLMIGQSRMNLGGFVALESLSGGLALAHWSTLTIKLTRGSKADSPTEKVEVDDEDHDGKKIKMDKVIGFLSIAKLEKIKISGAAVEGTEVRTPYLFEKGFVEK